MIEEITHFTIYLIAGMGFLSLIWIYQGLKNLTEGLLKSLFLNVFAIAGYAFAYTVWTFCAATGIIKIDIQMYWVLDSVFIVIFFILITRMAVYARKIGVMYGFKKDD